MRPQQWRLLQFRNYIRFPPQIASQHSQVQSLPHSLSSLMHTFTSNSDSNLAKPMSYIRYPLNFSIPLSRNFSSEIEQTKEKVMEEIDPGVVSVINNFEKIIDIDDLKRELELSAMVLTHDLVCKVLRNLQSKPDVAQRFFGFVSETDRQKLSSKSYNHMLRVLGVNGLLKEFWDLVDTMKKKGFGVAAHVRQKVTEKFEEDGSEGDLKRLREVFANGSTTDKSVENFSSRMCKIIKSEVWGDDVEKKLQELNISFSSDLVKMVLENLNTEPAKALIFFRWIVEGDLFKHDEKTYNAMARVLGREDCIDKLWKVLNEMKNDGYEMELETYVKILGRFVKRKMIKDAVDLYELGIACKSKPAIQSCTFLLRKIVVAKQLDMALFSRVMSIYTESGNALTDSMFDLILKSLTSVGRLSECNTVLKSMEEGGYVASGMLLSKAAFKLSSTRKTKEASEFMDHVEASGSDFKSKTLASLIEGHCVAGNLEKASNCFQKLIENGGVSSAGYAFNSLVDAYSRRNKAMDACKLMHKYVGENMLKPWHDTYKTLITKLLVQGEFKDACSLLDSMKDNGYPPFVDPFVDYLSKSGSADDTIYFLRAMTSKTFPSTSVALRMFEAFFHARRHGVAQDVLAKCPHFIRDHPDVLDLFCIIKSGNVPASTLPLTA